MTLVRGAAEGVPFDRIAPVYERYVRSRPSKSRYEMWSCVHRLASISAGKTLRIITAGPAVIYYQAGDCAEVTTAPTELGCWFADLPTASLQAGAETVFNLLCDSEHAGKEHRVRIVAE